MVFTHDMADWLSFNIDEAWLEENISWKDFGTGVRLGKLKREEKTSLVLYEAQSEVEVDAFMPTATPVASATSSSKVKCGTKTAPTPPAPSFGWTLNPRTRPRRAARR